MSTAKLRDCAAEPAFLCQVSPTKKVPLRALYLVAVVTVLLSLINIGSTTAFNAILSLSTLALYVSYLIPITLLTLKRLHHDTHDMAWGPFHLGRWGLPINIFGIIYAVYVSIFLPFPPTQPVTWVNMNYAGPVLGAVLVFGAFDWFVRGRRHFHGPTVKVAKG
jgi:choline transport protein